MKLIYSITSPGLFLGTMPLAYHIKSVPYRRPAWCDSNPDPAAAVRALITQCAGFKDEPHILANGYPLFANELNPMQFR